MFVKMTVPAKSNIYFYFLNYTLNYSPVNSYNHTTSFTSRKVFSFWGNQLQIGHL